MKASTLQTQCRYFELIPFFVCLMILGSITLSFDAQALPAFARQTGQNCVSCHAGGQFPELTPYGRIFKMTGYTIGERTLPFSAMGVINAASVADRSKSDLPADDFQKNGNPVFSSASLFIAGKVTDNIGLFSQITYDHYAGQHADGSFYGHSSADNIDLRYADRFVNERSDLIVGVSVNNNPSVSDPWNTAAAWMQYVPAASLTSHQFTDANTPYPGNSTGGNIAGISGYAYWNALVYAELGTYQTAKGLFRPMSAGMPAAETTKLKGRNNPYWRLALTHEWGPHNVMVGVSGNYAHIYDDPADTTNPNSVHRVKTTGVDGQYQFLLDPHTVTAQIAYTRQRTNYSANEIAANAGVGSPFGFFAADGITSLPDANSADTTNTFRTKLSYVYQAKYGGSAAYFNLSGTTNTANQSSGYDNTATIIVDPGTSRVNSNFSGNPAMRGMTYELFYTPIQYVRLGGQYTAYSKFNGASSNYDGLGRNAKDNNTLFLYVWAAY